ncbi:hypothetical protein DV515_00004855 [Chloebia gouldiae]|uniref:Uncharacterized protein n=1 Tax=Chloebia gouldiae TaxID=44316 RepID=A0A3L8SQ06_CHLGU|nr:hypothetical protein DV515_00004855 [Chloebia gouldiae]
MSHADGAMHSLIVASQPQPPFGGRDRNIYRTQPNFASSSLYESNIEALANTEPAQMSRAQQNSRGNSSSLGYTMFCSCPHRSKSKMEWELPVQ